MRDDEATSAGRDALVKALMDAESRRQEIGIKLVCEREGIAYAGPNSTDLQRFSMYAELGFVLVRQQNELKPKRRRGRPPKYPFDLREVRLAMIVDQILANQKERGMKTSTKQVVSDLADYALKESGVEYDVLGTLLPQVSRGRKKIDRK